MRSLWLDCNQGGQTSFGSFSAAWRYYLWWTGRMDWLLSSRLIMVVAWIFRNREFRNLSLIQSFNVCNNNLILLHSKWWKQLPHPREKGVVNEWHEVSMWVGRGGLSKVACWYSGWWLGWQWYAGERTNHFSCRPLSLSICKAGWNLRECTSNSMKPTFSQSNLLLFFEVNLQWNIKNLII